MSAHTPGPWLISYKHEDGTKIAIDDAHGIDGERNYDLVTVEHGDPDELLANAHLVAAAPELLKALQDVIGWVPGGSAWHTDAAAKSVERARAVIAKATGSAA